MPLLVIEDDDDLREVMTDVLLDAGFAVQTVSNPVQAERLLRANHFALVLADYFIDTPEHSERAAAAVLDAAGPVPVGCVTAWNRVPPELMARYTFILRKPVDLQQLLGAVGRYAIQERPDLERAVVIDRYFQALGNSEWDGLVALCTDTVEYHLPGTDPLAGTIIGREAFQAYAEETFRSFPKARFQVTDVSWLPHGAVASYRSEWTVGQTVNGSTGAVCFRFDGTRIAAVGVRTDLGRIRAMQAEARGHADGQRACGHAAES